MFESIKTYIELQEERLPIKCDLLVLEKIQEEYRSISAFEEGLITWEAEQDKDGNEVRGEDGEVRYKGKIPDMKVVNTALYLMANEGEEILAEQEKRPPKAYTREELARKVNLRPTILANILHGEFYRCFQIKNPETTRNPKKEIETSK